MERSCSRENEGAGDLSGDYLLLSLLGVLGRIPPLAFSYLKARDRWQLPLVSKTLQRHLEKIDYAHCKDGRNMYRVPYPGFPGLLEEKIGCGLFPHQLANLAAMHRFENPTGNQYGALRGGILADAPGLGKTITMLALIVSTAGRRPLPPPEFWKPESIAEGWQALTQNPECTMDICKTIQPFRRLDQILKPGDGDDVQSTTTTRRTPTKRISVFRWLEYQVRPPYPPERFPNLPDFERFVRKAVKPHATDAELELFRRNVNQLKAGLHKSHRKVLKSEAGRRMAWERDLIPTSATLLIVPDALLEHWFQQIHQHVNLSLFADEKEGDKTSTSDDGNGKNEEARGVVYLDGVGDMADARMPLGHVNLDMNQSVLLPWELSKYMIVVTTFSRCQFEYQKEVVHGRLGCDGTPQASQRRTGRKRKFDLTAEEEMEEEFHVDGSRDFRQASAFLQLRWLRIVVDEGHELGGGSSEEEESSGLTRYIHQVAAERRWVLSGTPTTGNEDDDNFSAKALDQLQRLLLFLRHPVYGTMSQDDETTTKMSPYVHSLRTAASQKKASKKVQKQKAKEAWAVQIKDRYLAKDQEARAELLKVLRSVIVMHRKEDIHLPKPVFRQVEVDVRLPDEVQANIRQSRESGVMLLQNYLKTNEFQSLVDKAQGEHIISSIQLAKKALQERGGPLSEADGQLSMIRMLSAEDVKERGHVIPSVADRRPIKAVVYSSNKFNLRDVTEVLYASLPWESIAEAYDDPRFDSSSELSRFRNNRKECRKCPVCGYQNDYAGSANKSRNIKGGGDPKCRNYLLEVVKRDDPSIRFLVEAGRVLRSVPVGQGGNVSLERLGGLPHAQYKIARNAWRIDDILEVDIQDPHPLLVKRRSHEEWLAFGADECVRLAQADRHLGRDWFFGPLPVPSLDALSNGTLPRSMEVVLSKWQPCSHFHNPAWYKGPKLSQVPLETIREDVFVLSLDAGLAHGLDLSFVTHIFLLEPVDDAALLEQITSRAHRLGATGPVTVETVNTFFKVDPETEKAVEISREHQKHYWSKGRLRRSSSSKIGKNDDNLNATIKNKRDKDSSLTKVVCQYCYRHFDSMLNAEAHEAKQCPRNPANVDVVDPWHLSSVYREIRPPPPKLFG